MREALLAAARAGFYTPVWSDHVLSEWQHVADKRGDGAMTAAEIARLGRDWPKAAVRTPTDLSRYYLSDANDIPILAAAVSSSAQGIVTSNAKDFPRHILAEEGLTRNDPDALLLGFYHADNDAMRRALTPIAEKATALSGETWTLAALMKKARLPRLAKAMRRV